MDVKVAEDLNVIWYTKYKLTFLPRKRKNIFFKLKLIFRIFDETKE